MDKIQGPYPLTKCFSSGHSPEHPAKKCKTHSYHFKKSHRVLQTGDSSSSSAEEVSTPTHSGALLEREKLCRAYLRQLHSAPAEIQSKMNRFHRAV